MADSTINESITDLSDIEDIKEESIECLDIINDSPIKRYIDSQNKKRQNVDTDSESQPFVPISWVNKKKKKIEDSENSLLSYTSLKKLETNSNIDDINQVESRFWVDECKPKNIDDLCIHNRKLKDLNNEISDLIYKRTDNKILVISGPSGCGKSTSAKIIANKIMKEKIDNYKKCLIYSEISENLNKDKNYDNEEINENENSEEYLVEFNILKDSHYGNSSIKYFEEFLNQCKLLTGINEKCVIIEELPNLFHKETQKIFQKSLIDWILTNDLIELPPLIICITEFEIDNDFNYNQINNFTIDNIFKVETIFGYKLIEFENVGWKRIKFNKVAKTILKKALLKVCNIKKISNNKRISSKIDELSLLGDIRNAVNTFEFWYKFQNFNNGKNDNNSKIQNESKGKEIGIDIFHSIGKLLYGTKHEEEEFEKFKKRLNNSFINKNQVINTHLITVDNVSNEIYTNLNKFNLCLLENYDVINPKLDNNLVEFIDILSETDNMVNKINQTNQLKFLQNVSFFSCYGIRTFADKLKNDNKVDINKNNKVKFTRDSKLWKKIIDTNKEIELFKKRRKGLNGLNKLDILLIDGFYESKILNSFKYRLKIFNKFGDLTNYKKCEFRIGGKFTNNLIADDEFKVFQNDDDSGEEDEDNEISNGERDKGIWLMNGGRENIGGIERSLVGVENQNYNLGVIHGLDDDFGEIDSDPIENSDDGNNGKNGGVVKREEEEEEDCFSDDSEVEQILCNL